MQYTILPEYLVPHPALSPDWTKSPALFYWKLSDKSTNSEDADALRSGALHAWCGLRN
jgi:hypothetical protein